MNSRESFFRKEASHSRPRITVAYSPMAFAILFFLFLLSSPLLSEAKKQRINQPKTSTLSSSPHLPKKGPLNPIYFLEVPTIPGGRTASPSTFIPHKEANINNNDPNQKERSISPKIIYQQKVGRYDPYSSNDFIVYFKTFEVGTYYIYCRSLQNYFIYPFGW